MHSADPQEIDDLEMFIKERLAANPFEKEEVSTAAGDQSGSKSPL